MPVYRSCADRGQRELDQAGIRLLLRGDVGDLALERSRRHPQGDVAGMTVPRARRWRRGPDAPRLVTDIAIDFLIALVYPAPIFRSPLRHVIILTLCYRMLSSAPPSFAQS